MQYKRWQILKNVGNALTKSKVTKVCWDAPIFILFNFNFNHLPAAASKKGLKYGASQQTFGPSYFDRALGRKGSLVIERPLTFLNRMLVERGH